MKSLIPQFYFKKLSHRKFSHSLANHTAQIITNVKGKPIVSHQLL